MTSAIWVFKFNGLNDIRGFAYSVQENDVLSIVFYFQIIKFVTDIMNFTYYNDIILS